MKIAVTTSSFAEFSDEPLRLLRDKGLEPVMNPHGRTLSEDEAIALLQSCAGVVAGTEPLTGKVMAALPELKVISRCGAGMDSVDLDAAAKRGIAVFNTPDAPTRAVAELTLGLALDLARHISLMDREVRAGTWKKRMGNLLQGARVGIIGFGRIGRAVAALFAALGCETAFFDPMLPASIVDDADSRSRRMDMPALLAWSDIVTLHAAKPKNGGPILGAAAIAGMKPGARLLNVARGGLVDEDALAEALRSGKLAGAALDVFGKEPYQGPLSGISTAVLTPHVGSYAKESRILMEVETVHNLLRGLGLE